MNKYLNQDELIDRLSDYAGENLYNKYDRFMEEAGGNAWLAQSLAQEDAILKRIAREQAREQRETERFN
jgi:hypothetical protein